MAESDTKTHDSLENQSLEIEILRNCHPSGAPMSPWERIAFIMVTAGVVLVLMLAAYLKPSATGFGTHQQLGLPPCTFYWITGFPCPSCGMTTSFSQIMHGNMPGALRANWPGALAACCCVLFVPWSILSIRKQRFLGLQKPDQFFLTLVLTLLLLTLLHWCLLILGWY